MTELNFHIQFRRVVSATLLALADKKRLASWETVALPLRMRVVRVALSQRRAFSSALSPGQNISVSGFVLGDNKRRTSVRLWFGERSCDGVGFSWPLLCGCYIESKNNQR